MGVIITPIPDVQFLSLTAAYTTASQTALQKMFNTGSSGNGSLTVLASTLYEFECQWNLTALSATTSDFGFGFLGTATFTSISYLAIGIKQAQNSAANAPGMARYAVATYSAVCPQSGTTSGSGYVKGYIRVNGGGTLIPATGVSTAAAAIIGANSFFKLTRIIAPETTTTIGGI